MKKLSTEQKQFVYEFLLEKGVPDLYAALIAERQENSMPELFTVSDALYGGFDWESSTEGLGFWCDLTDELANNIPEYVQNKVDIVLEDKPEVVETADDYHILKLDPEYRIPSQTMPKAPSMQQPLDYEIKDGEVFGYVDKEEPELTFWQKVKFYIGRLFYKV